jgi:hypothetical protein
MTSLRHAPFRLSPGMTYRLRVAIASIFPTRAEANLRATADLTG